MDTRKILSVENVDYISDIAHRAFYKAKAVVDSNNIFLYICNELGECVWASEKLSELFGVSQEDMLGYGWTLAIKHSDRKAAFDNWESAVRNKTPYEDYYCIEVNDVVKNIYTTTKICFYYDPILKKNTDKIRFYIGTVEVLK